MAIGPMVTAGDWDDAVERVAEVLKWPEVSVTSLSRLLPAVTVHVQRGSLDQARELLGVCASLEHSEEIQSRSMYACVKAVLLHAEEKYEDALVTAAEAAHAWEELSAGSYGVKLGLVEQIEAAAALDPAKAEALLSELEHLRPGETTAFLRAQAARLRASLVPAAVEQDSSTAANMFRELSVPFWLAVTLLEHAEWLAAQGRTSDAAPLLIEAREIFERLQARPWLDRLARTTSLETISA